MKRKDEGKAGNMKCSVRNEAIKKNDKKVEFIVSAPEANEVYLVGEFNRWDVRSMPMKRGKDGNWKVQTSLAPGRYEYKFVVDDRWVEDSPAAEFAVNSFGTQNLVLRVG